MKPRNPEESENSVSCVYCNRAFTLPLLNKAHGKKAHLQLACSNS